MALKFSSSFKSCLLKTRNVNSKTYIHIFFVRLLGFLHKRKKIKIQGIVTKSRDIKLSKRG